MQKWEYCQILEDYGAPLGRGMAKLKFFQSDNQGREAKNQSGLLFALLGKEGWEMVAATVHPTAVSGPKVIYSFKRTIEENNPI